MATQKPTNRLKTRNPPKIKILLKLKYVVLGVFKVKKTLKRNPPHHMEPSNIKINCLTVTPSLSSQPKMTEKKRKYRGLK
jgi:hypothetical protein